MDNHYDSQGPVVTGVSIGFAVLTFIVLSVRLFSRLYVMGKMGIDDCMPYLLQTLELWDPLLTPDCYRPHSRSLCKDSLNANILECQLTESASIMGLHRCCYCGLVDTILVLTSLRNLHANEL